MLFRSVQTNMHRTKWQNHRQNWFVIMHIVLVVLPWIFPKCSLASDKTWRKLLWKQEGNKYLTTHPMLRLPAFIRKSTKNPFMLVMHTCPLRSESGIHSKDTVSKDLSQKLWGGIFRDFWSLKLYTILKKTHTHNQIKRKQNSQAAIYHIKRKFKFFWARQEIPPLPPPDRFFLPCLFLL